MAGNDQGFDRDDCFIVLGVGGSGMKTLLRCNELLANDRELRPHLRKLVFYVIADTALDELRDFERQVLVHLGGRRALCPLVHRIELSDTSYAQLPPLVGQFMPQLFRPDAALTDQELLSKKRLMQHWWVAPADAPFKARGVFDARLVPDIVKGAGQCPFVSYFLTWARLDRIRQGLDEFISEIVSERAGYPEPLRRAGLYTATSFVGGTGRGSWMPLTFTLRELLAKRGVICNPAAFIFDAQAFIKEQTAKTRVTMRVNSLTGMSELSCWIRNLRPAGAEEPYVYSLPNLTGRVFDPMSDLVGVGTDTVHNPNRTAPVNSSLLVFDRSRSAVLGGCNQAFEMAGAGLYARIAKWVIGNQDVNENFPFNGLGTAVFEVPVETLREYYEHESRLTTVNDLLRPASQELVQDLRRALLARTNTNVHNGEPERSLFDRRKDGSLLPRIFQELAEILEPGIREPTSDELRKGGADPLFAQDSPKAVQTKVSALLKPDPERAQEAVVRVLTASGTDPIEAIRSLVQSALMRDHLDRADAPPEMSEDVRRILTERNGGRPLSVTQAISVLDAVIEAWRTGLQALPEAGEGPGTLMAAHHRDDPLAVVKRHSDRDLSKAFLFGVFTTAERVDIRNAVRDALPYCNYGLVHGAISQYFLDAIRALELLRANAAALEAALRKVGRRFEYDLHCLGAGEWQSTEPRKALFLDPEAPEERVPTRGDRKLFYRRLLWPEYVPLPETSREVGQTLYETCHAYVTQPERVSDDDGTADRMEAGLEHEVRTSASVRQEFLIENFSVTRVVENLGNLWMKRIAKLRGDQNRVDELLNQFAAFFGIRPVEQDGRYRIPTDVTAFVACMAGSLLANCRPYWELAQERGLGDDPRVYLFLPISSADWTRAGTAITSQITKMAGLEGDGAGIAIVPGSTRRDNPFVILAYTSYGVSDLKDIQSLDYWRGDAELREWLDRAESPTGRSLFEDSTSGSWINKGLGFVDPIYVRETKLRNRWRPWYREPLADTGPVRADQTLDAMLYALTQPKGEVAAQLEKAGWKLPLLVRGQNQRFRYARRPYEVSDGEVKEYQGNSWSPGAELAVRVARVFDVLHAQEIKEDNVLTPVEAILKEMALFWTEVAPSLDFGTPKSKAYKNFWQALINDLSGQRQEADEIDHEVLDQLVARAYKHRDASKAPG